MRRILVGLALLAAAGALGFYLLTIPRGLPEAALAGLPAGDATRGERIFWVGGCASCHAAEGAKGEDRLKLGGGRVLRTGFGNFVVPNISSHPTDGIGGWSTGDLANAMQRGISPDGRHLYPAFPYASYVRMKPEDIADLRAFLATLPAVEGVQAGPDLRFPYNIRRGIGLWKLVFLSAAPAVRLTDPTPEAQAGQYLAEAPGHCGECHTPATSRARWRRGAGSKGAGGGRGREGAEHHARSGGSAAGRRGTSPPISRPASRPISTRSAAAWSRSRKISRCCPTLIARRWRPI